MKTIIALLLSLIVLPGCSTPQSVRKMEGQGMKMTYDAPFKRVLAVAITACNQGDLRVKDVNPETGYIFANSLARMESWGENVAVWVRARGSEKTEVEVVSKHSGPHVLIHVNWEEDILNAIRVGLIREELTQTK